MKIGIFLTGQHPPGSDVLAELEGQYAMTRLARDKGWDAVATGQHYLSEGVRQLQLVPFLARNAPSRCASRPSGNARSRIQSSVTRAPLLARIKSSSSVASGRLRAAGPTPDRPHRRRSAGK